MLEPNPQSPTDSYFINQWRLNSTTSSSSIHRIEDEEAVPNELDTFHSSGMFSIVLPDKLTVKYPNTQLHGHDVGVVQANKPAPVKRLVYYFEMFVKNAGVKGQIAIGFTTEGFKGKMRRQPGWEANSYGYHGDDGYLYRGQGKGELFGPTYTVNDTVGGGINYASQKFFFTKNGEMVGDVCKEVKGRLYPTIAVHSQNEEVSVNFGKEPFVFDLKAYEEQERAKQQMTIEKTVIPQNASNRIVRSYLLHYGYEETLQLFDNASGSSVPPISLTQENGFNEHDKIFGLTDRRILRQLIRNGKIDEAFGKLRDSFPQEFQDDTSATCFLLHCQKFIELVREANLEEAIFYGRSAFEKFYEFAEYKDLLKDCSALLVYEQPEKSSVGYLLEDSQREIVADAVNAFVLSVNPNLEDRKSCLQSHLEKLLRQLTACFLERRSLNGDQGEAFHIRRILEASVRRV